MNGTHTEIPDELMQAAREQVAQEIEQYAGDPGEFWQPSFRNGLLAGARIARDGSQQ